MCVCVCWGVHEVGEFSTILLYSATVYVTQLSIHTRPAHITERPTIEI